MEVSSCVVTGNNSGQCKDCGEVSLKTRQLQHVETPRDPFVDANLMQTLLKHLSKRRLQLNPNGPTFIFKMTPWEMR